MLSSIRNVCPLPTVGHQHSQLTVIMWHSAVHTQMYGSIGVSNTNSFSTSQLSKRYIYSIIARQQQQSVVYISVNVWYKSHATCDSISLQIYNTVRLLIQLHKNIYYALYKDSPVFTVRIYNHLFMESYQTILTKY